MFIHELCVAVARVWRAPIELCDKDVRIIDLPDSGNAWLRYREGVPAGDFASMAETKLIWATVTSPLTETMIDKAERTLRAHSCERAFVWISPVGWNSEVESMLLSRGAKRVPYVRYPVLVRETTPVQLDRENGFNGRVLTAKEASNAFDIVAPWYGSTGMLAAKRRAEAGIAEFHAAFDGDKPIAIGALFVDGNWSYIGWMGTDPEYRSRGAQAALIRSRVERAAARGAKWCIAETNTVVDISLRNLIRHGFVPAMEWVVCQWDVI